MPVAIKVLDVNDNAPEFASEHEAFLCENGKPGQVSIPGFMWCETGLDILPGTLCHLYSQNVCPCVHANSLNTNLTA